MWTSSAFIITSMSFKTSVLAAVIILAGGVGGGVVMRQLNPQHSTHAQTRSSSTEKKSQAVTSDSAVAVVRPQALLSSDEGTSYFGEILSDLDGQIYSLREGVVEKLLVNLGSRVSSGQTVALLSAGQRSPEYAGMLAERESMVIKARAMVESATSDLARAKILGATGAQETVEVITQRQMIENTKKETSAMTAFEQENLRLKGRAVQVAVRTVYNTILQIFYGGTANNNAGSLSSSTFGLLKPQTLNDFPVATSALKEVITKIETVSLETSSRKGIEAADKAIALLDATVVSEDYPADMMTDDRMAMNESKMTLVDAWSDYQEQIAMVTRSQASAQAKISDQEQMLSRMRADAEKMLITAEADLDAATRARDIVAGASSDRAVRSPFSGVITERLVNVGEKIDMGTPLFAIVDNNRSGSVSSLFVRFEVPESELDSLRSGASVTITRTQQPLEKITAVIERIGSGITANSRSILVEARLKSPPSSVLPHATVRVVTTGTVALSTIPRDAVRTGDNGALSVFVVRDGVIVEQQIVTSRIIADRVIVSRGVIVEDQIVMVPSTVKIGQKVEVTEAVAVSIPTSETASSPIEEHGGHSN